eukprot:1448606-Rhodomonas_salina.1
MRQTNQLTLACGDAVLLGGAHASGGDQRQRRAVRGAGESAGPAHPPHRLARRDRQLPLHRLPGKQALDWTPDEVWV